MIEREGFRFADSLAETEEEKRTLGPASTNLCRRRVAAIGDESAVMWQLHSDSARTS